MKNIIKILKQEALKGMRNGDGGPFSAVVVKDGKIISRAHNMVIGKKNPILHAEIVAIQKACKKLDTFDLSDCEIYSSCEPCPMCFSAIHWARIGKLFYILSREDAAKIGFDDRKIYEILEGTARPAFDVEKIVDENGLNEVFKEWEGMDGKQQY